MIKSNFSLIFAETLKKLDPDRSDFTQSPQVILSDYSLTA